MPDYHGLGDEISAAAPQGTDVEFFGKRGRSWHISAVVTHSQEEGKCQVECFVHLFLTCEQNSFAVMSVIEHLLNTIKIEYPSINKAFLRSDNAGCYHSGP